MYEDLNERILTVFQSHHSAIDPEIQQRSVEYSIMAQYDDQDLISQVWEAMPDFPERDSPLMRIINKNEQGLGAGAASAAAVFRDTFSGADEDEEEEEEEAAPVTTQQAPAQTQPQEQDFMTD